MPMFPPETLTLIGTVVGIGIALALALATLILVTTTRSSSRIDEHIASTDNNFDKYLAEAANDRRALLSVMDEFRWEMRRLAGRQSRVVGHRSGTAAAAD